MKTINLYIRKEDVELVESFGATYNHEKNCYQVEDNYLNRFKFAKWISMEESFLFYAENIQNVSLKIGKNIAKNLCDDLYNAKKRIYILSPNILESNNFLEILKSINSYKNIHLKVFSTVEDKEELTKKSDILENIIKYQVTEDIEKIYERNESIKKYQSEINIRENEFNIKLDKKEKEIREKESEIQNVEEEISKTKKANYLNIFLFFILIILAIVFGYFAQKLKIYPLGVIAITLIIIAFYTIFRYIENKNRIKEIIKTLEILNLDKLELINQKNKLDENYKNLIENLFNMLNESKNRDIRKVEYFSECETKFFSISENIERNIYPNMNIYLIDDSIYMGSLNFSINGLFKNLETLIKITDRGVVESIVKYINDYEKYFGFKFYETEDIASAIYNEDNILSETKNENEIDLTIKD